MTLKEEFEEIYKNSISRDGADTLLLYLQKSDFFTAPASSRFHGAEEGGLVKHSIFVYKRLLKIIKSEFGDNYQTVYSDETLAVTSLLHDLCKVNYYKTDYRNSKENGVWVKVPYFAVEDMFPYGHGEKSVFILNNFIKLSKEEAMAINWHMGGFDDRVKGNPNIIGEAFKKFPLSVYLHSADLQATYIDEKTVRE